MREAFSDPAPLPRPDSLSAAFSRQLSALGPFESRPHLAIAVSGGSDSMALLLLAQDWARQHGGRVIALTVDHRLRTESAQEARQVAQWCSDLNIEHHTLTWHTPADTGIQAQAREARYALLGEWCRSHHVLHLLTAHHRDDQAETLFFRIARGSGLAGLSCMQKVSYRAGVRLLRPLLDSPKPELARYLQRQGQGWVEDPTNAKPDYTRNRLRQSMAQGADTLSGRASAVAQSCLNFSNRLLYNEVSYSTKCISLYPEGCGHIQLEEFRATPMPLALPMLSGLVQTLSGESYPARSEQLLRHYEAIQTGLLTRRSFGGLLWTPQPKYGRVVVYREPSALPVPVTMVTGTQQLWDKRFMVSYTGPREARLRALGKEGMAFLAQAGHPLPRHAEKHAFYALPSLWVLEQPVCVPHMHYSLSGYAAKAAFRPAKALAGGTFFSMNT